MKIIMYIGSQCSYYSYVLYLKSFEIKLLGVRKGEIKKTNSFVFATEIDLTMLEKNYIDFENLNESITDLFKNKAPHYKSVPEIKNSIYKLYRILLSRNDAEELEVKHYFEEAKKIIKEYYIKAENVLKICTKVSKGKVKEKPIMYNLYNEQHRLTFIGLNEMNNGSKSYKQSLVEYNHTMVIEKNKTLSKLHLVYLFNLYKTNYEKMTTNSKKEFEHVFEFNKIVFLHHTLNYGIRYSEQVGGTVFYDLSYGYNEAERGLIEYYKKEE